MGDREQRRARVVVIGSYAVGLVMRTSRIPARGETVLGRDFRRMDGGKGSNQAVACARLGAHTTFVAAIGDDAYGREALALLAREGVDASHVRNVPELATGAGFIVVADDGDNAIAVDLGANRALSRDDIDRAEGAIAEADVVLAQLEIPLDTVLYAVAVARRHGVRTILNPAPAPELPVGDLSDVDILTPNVTEAQAIAGWSHGDASTLGAALLRNGVGAIVLTVGENGAHIIDGRGGRAVPTYPVDAVDTTGAGDAFSAALAVALGEGEPLDDAVAFACLAGAFSVQSLGTVPSYATRAELAALRRRVDDRAAPRSRVK